MQGTLTREGVWMQTSCLRQALTLRLVGGEKIAKKDDQGPCACQLVALVIGMAQLIVELFQLMYR